MFRFNSKYAVHLNCDVDFKIQLITLNYVWLYTVQYPHMCSNYAWFKHIPSYALHLKGAWHEIFDFRFFHDSVSPKPLSIRK